MHTEKGACTQREVRAHRERCSSAAALEWEWKTGSRLVSDKPSKVEWHETHAMSAHGHIWTIAAWLCLHSWVSLRRVVKEGKVKPSR